jgi:proline dehydrogenase
MAHIKLIFGGSQTLLLFPCFSTDARFYRTPIHLEQSIRDARAGGYAIGVKLVRGAYHEHEIAAHSLTSSSSPSISDEFDPPVFLAKVDTDECYNSCAKVLIQSIKRDILDANLVPHIGALFGTHNRDSCQIVLEELAKQDLAIEDKQDDVLHLGGDVSERLAFGQLLGKSSIGFRHHGVDE